MPGWHGTSRHERGYGAAWVKVRGQALARDGHLCQPCKRRGRPTQATAVDHIVPKAKGGTDDLGNLEAVCDHCHRAKTQAEATGKTKTTFGLDGWPNP